MNIKKLKENTELIINENTKNIEKFVLYGMEWSNNSDNTENIIAIIRTITTEFEGTLKRLTNEFINYESSKKETTEINQNN